MFEKEYSNDLENYFYKNQKRLIHKWIHYFDVYDQHFSKFRNKKINVLEIGVDSGGSLQMWKDYFGDQAKIYGIDINPQSRFDEDRIKVFIGSQSDRTFLENALGEIGLLDLVIDDGCHRCPEQIVSFEYLFPSLQDDGVYLCEDTHSCYLPRYGGDKFGLNTFVQYCKKMVDSMHHEFNSEIKANDLTKKVGSVCFYNSMVVVTKKPKNQSKSYWTTTGKQKKPNAAPVKMM